MKQMILKLMTVILMLGLLSACGENHDDAPAAPAVEARGDKPAFLGDLDKKFSEIYDTSNELYFDPCDFNNRTAILEIARSLEKRRSEIESFEKKQAEESKQEFTKIGPFQFFNPAKDETALNKWENSEWSWDYVIKLFHEVESQPTNAQWLRLNRLVRGIVGDESDRLLTGAFFGATRGSGPLLLATRDVAQKCADDETCFNPGFTDEQMKFLTYNGLLKVFLPDLGSNLISTESKRKTIRAAANLISQSAVRFEFAVNPTARVEGKTLQVPMDLSAFEDGQQTFINWIEKNWNTDPDFKIKIVAAEKPDAGFTVKVSNAVGGRAEVVRRQKSMQLYNHDSLKVVAHEFGHVLGFRDTYYTTWNKERCTYNDELNGGDIMSEHRTGKVLPSHWADLKKNYWK